MSQTVKSIVAEIGIDTRKFTSGVNAIKSKTDSITSALGSISTVAVTAAAAVSAVAVAAFKVGQAGASVVQTKESFQRLEDTLGSNVDLLSELQDVSDNTVDDMTLMSSTLTLVAGAGDELRSSLLQATPELLEIAKAANKLNPSLGDTAFMYESIATGVKRGSPLILDNLGIMVKAGEANEEYAAQLGKTVDELTAEEKQMALLNATLKAGNTLIEQAGGAAGSATDPFDQFTTAVTNAKNSMTEMSVGPVAELVTSFAEMINKNTAVRQATEKMTAAVEDGIITQREMNLWNIRTAGSAEDWIWVADQVAKKQELINRVTKAGTPITQMNYKAIQDMTDGLNVAAAAETEYTDAMLEELERRNQAMSDFNEFKIDEVAKFSNIEEDYYESSTENAKDLEAVQAELALRRSQGYAEWGGTITDLVAKEEELKTKAQEIEDAHDKATKAIILGYMEQKMAADGILTDEETEWLLAKGAEWGIYSDNAVAQMEYVMDEAQRMYDELNGMNIDIYVNTHQRIGTSGGGGGGAAGMPYEMNADGTNGTMTVPPGFPNDSYTVGLSSGEEYSVTTANNAANSSQSAPSIEIDYARIGEEVKEALLQSGAIG